MESKWSQPFMGNCELFAQYLSDKQSFGWICVRFFDALLRGFGQVIMSNNPFSGLLFLIGLCLFAPIKAICGLIGGSISVLWAYAIGHTVNDISDGIYTYNSILLVCFAHHALPTIFFTYLHPFIWFALFIAIVLCVYITSAMNGFLSKWNIPCLTLPFILIEYLFIISIINNHHYVQTNISLETNSFEQIFTVGLELMENVTENNFPKVILSGTIHSAGCLLAIENTALSCIIYLAIVIYSPLTALMSCCGAFLSTAVALILFNVPHIECALGQWGYNGLLTGAALGGLTWILNVQTVLATLFAILYATFIQFVFTYWLFVDSDLLQYNLAFNCSTMTFLCISIGTFPRPECISYPEKHYRLANQLSNDDDELIRKRVQIVQL